MAAIAREFDYLVPDAWSEDGRAASLAVGSMVRIELHGRRVAGWVTELDPQPEPGIELRPLAKLSGVGPPPEIVELARWAAHRWAGSLATVLRTANPPTMVAKVPAPRPSRVQEEPDLELVHKAFQGQGAIVRIPPTGDRWPLILGAVARGNSLILVPSAAQARVVAGRLKQRGVAVGLHPRDWAQGAAGATVVGTRSAAFAPVQNLAAVLVVDEHDEVYQDERTPTWHAREVVFERAKRASVPCVLTSPIPTAAAREHLPMIAPDRKEERAGWPSVAVVDPRDDGSARGGLWTEAAVRLLRDTPGRCAIVLNRKGRSRLLACGSCDELAVCEECSGALRQVDETELVCTPHGHRRPVVCAHCGATVFKNLRIGVSRAREELEALVGEDVVEVTGDTDDRAVQTARVLVGTEAVLHRVDQLSAVVFADFDQELVAPRYRAAEEALALIVRAGRLVGGRGEGRGRILIQTRQPAHPVLTAATSADVERWTAGELARRRLLRYPPYAAIAHISGAAAAEFVDRMGSPLGVELQGPVDGAWLARAADTEVLADALAAVSRPKGRLRIAVNPLRV